MQLQVCGTAVPVPAQSGPLHGSPPCSSRYVAQPSQCRSKWDHFMGLHHAAPGMWYSRPSAGPKWTTSWVSTMQLQVCGTAVPVPAQSGPLHGSPPCSSRYVAQPSQCRPKVDHFMDLHHAAQTPLLLEGRLGGEEEGRQAGRATIQRRKMSCQNRPFTTEWMTKLERSHLQPKHRFSAPQDDTAATPRPLPPGSRTRTHADLVTLNARGTQSLHLSVLCPGGWKPAPPVKYNSIFTLKKQLPPVGEKLDLGLWRRGPCSDQIRN